MAQKILGVGAIRGDRGTPTKVVGKVPDIILVFFSSKGHIGTKKILGLGQLREIGVPRVRKARFWAINHAICNIHEPVSVSCRPSPLRYTTDVRNFE